MNFGQEAYIGVDCLNKIHSVLEKINPRKVFLVRGKKSYRLCGAESVINEALSKYSPEVFSYSDFQENPRLEDIQIGLSYLEAFNPDIIIAIGGGSVLDISKLIRFFYSYVGNPIGTKFEKKKDLLPLLVLPTTAGTGCEATHFAVMYKNQVKYSVEHDDILPDYVFVYPPFTYNNPAYLTACTGFDALAQGIEALWNVNATEESDKYAKKAISLLWSNLPLAINNATKEIRNNIAEGSFWAGKAINITKTTAPHAFSYPFTTYYGYPHGHAVALSFPYISELNLVNMKQQRKDVIMKAIQYDYTSNIRDYFSDYILNLGLNLRIDKAIDKKLILSNINVNRLNNNPVKINIKEAESIISLIIN